MHQIRLPTGNLVDLGPNWIHGTENNPILDIVKETNTATHSWEGEPNLFDEDGNLLPDGGTLSGLMWDIVVQAFKHSAKNTATIDPKESLYDFFLKKAEEKFPGDGEVELKRKKIVMQMSEQWGAFVGSSVEKQSLKFFWLEECIDGGQ